MWLFFLLEESQEAAFLLLRLLLGALIRYDRNTLGKFFAEFNLLFKESGDIEELYFFLRHQYSQAIYPFTGIVVLELAENAVDLMAFGTVNGSVRLFPFQNGLTEHRKVKHMNICLVNTLSDFVNLLDFTLQRYHLPPLTQVCIYDTTY